MSFWKELRRRHIFRIAAVYAATGWLVLQLGAIVFPALHAPAWCLPVLIGFIALGFPVALILAWAYEVTPEGVRRTETGDSDRGSSPNNRLRVGRTLNAAIVVVLAAAVGVLAWRLTSRGNADTGSSAGTIQAPSPSSAIPAKSIAVLPFENLSTDKSNAFFADGMQDLILTKLADIGDLKVISRTSTLQYGSHPQNLRSIAKQLGVATILEGSVQKAGNRVLINVQLISARDDSHLWAKSYTRTLKDIFGVEGDVAQKIAEALDAKITAPERRQLAATPTADPAAKNAYIRGRALLSTGSTNTGLQKAAAAYLQAVTLDPDFGLAWAALANAESQLYQSHVGDRLAHLALARKALRNAIALAPDAAETQVAVGLLRIGTHLDYRGALPAFRRAVSRAPGNADVLLNMARVQEALGSWNTAVRYSRKAVSLDPLNRDTLVRAADVLIDVRDFGGALDLTNRMLALKSDDPMAVATKAGIYQAEGRFTEAGKLLAGLNLSQPDAPLSRAFRFSLEQKFLVHDYSAIIHLLRPLVGPSSNLNPDWKVVYQPELARAEQLAGHRDAARVLYQAQVAEVKTLMNKESESDPYSQAVANSMLGEALAGLGHKTGALAAGRKAAALDSPRNDAALGPYFAEQLAAIEARVGEKKAAIKTLEHLLKIPYIEPITRPLLEADPRWNPLRRESGFQKLLKQRRVDPSNSQSAAVATP